MIRSKLKSWLDTSKFHGGVVLLIVLLQLVGDTVTAQVISRNSNEDVIVTYKDGSWRYFIATDSVLLLEEYQNFIERERQAALPPTDKEEVVPELPAKNIDESSVTRGIEESIEMPKTSIVDVVEEDELLKLELKERRLTLTERIRRVESGYIQLTEKDLKKVREELDELNVKIASLEPAVEDTANEPLVERGYRRSDYVFDVNIKSEPLDQCHVVKKYDKFTSREVAMVEPQFFFQYTPEVMRGHLKSGHYMDAYASVKQSNGFTNLVISFVVNSRNAKQDFGVLEERAQLKVKFLGGQTLILFNTTRDVGKIESGNNQIIYTGRYVLDANAIRSFEKEGIDTIRMSWSVGYEDYTIYFVDVIKEQLACLFKTL